MNKLIIFPAMLCLLNCGTTFGQVQRVAGAQQNPSPGRYNGRIIRSFTEPYQKSVAAGAAVGIVATADSKEGDFVKVGDRLATLNRRVLEASFEIAKARAQSTATLDAAKFRFELVRSQLESLRELQEKGHSNKYEIEQKQSEFETTQAEFKAAQDEMVLAELEVNRIQAELDDRVIRSPIDGYVTEIHKQPGENLSSNEPQYATVVSLDKLRIRFYVDAEMLRSKRVGQPVVVEVGRNRQTMQGTIDYVSPIVDSDSGVGRLEVIIQNETGGIQSGVVAYMNEAETDRVAAEHSNKTVARTPVPVRTVSQTQMPPSRNEQWVTHVVLPQMNDSSGKPFSKTNLVPSACQRIRRRVIAANVTRVSSDSQARRP